MADAPPPALVAGIDLATADVRVAVADGAGRVVARATAALAPPHRPEPGTSEQDPATWWPAVARSLREALARVEGEVVAVAVSATSGTVVLAGHDLEPVGPAVLYDDRRAAPGQRWGLLLDRPGAASAAHAWHASDLVVARLTGRPPRTDWSHALKTGFDPACGRWSPTDRGRLDAMRPTVAPPASYAGPVSPDATDATGLPAGCAVRLGMTDACAAQVAAGADRPGRFVTVLGTTLVVKGGSDGRIDDPPSGVYSHRHPDGWWLPGGASNTGGGALAARADRGEMAGLDRQAAARGPAATVCYPLPGRGERFPFVADGAEEAWTAPPEDRVEEYRAVLEGVAFVERLGYERLAQLGAPLQGPVRTAGGGAASPAWSAVRATVLGVPVVRTESADTAFGACVLAAAGTLHETLAAATDAMVRAPGGEVEPVAGEQDRLDESYQRFLSLVTERGWVAWRG